LGVGLRVLGYGCRVWSIDRGRGLRRDFSGFLLDLTDYIGYTYNKSFVSNYKYLLTKGKKVIIYRKGGDKNE
jgi:hypothetical protein